MNSRVSGGRPVAWEDAGRQIASLLGSYVAVVVTSADPLPAAHVALGIGRAEAKHRRVVIGDLVGDLPPLRSLVSEEDPHGITDSFLYGVSLNKIGYEVAGSDNLYVMPSGTDPAIGPEILRSARWKRLAAGFGDAGALLLLVAGSDATGLTDLVEQTDGVVLVKDADLAVAPSALVLARVASPTPTLKIPLHRLGERAASWKQHRWFYPALAAIALVLIASVGLAVILTRLGQARPRPTRVVAKP
ncbi:MAG TPA: hypothetical protein VEK37_10925, partial [Gemmatimonadaceae bacterium]|nr:hypothetical protein [Gemmatimonadaceae bacterium]